MEGLGFEPADFDFEAPTKGAWCLLGLGHPKPALELVPTSPQ